MKRKGFTLVELLVVIGIIALLMGILMPVLGKVRALAFRVLCGSNLSGIGKAMMIYSNEYDDEYPLAGGRNSIWSNSGEIENWWADTDILAFGSTHSATIGSNFYLLIKYTDCVAKQFVCKGDTGAEVFKISIFTSPPDGYDPLDAWDFGGDDDGVSTEFCSYSFHQPFGISGTRGRPITPSSSNSSPLCADRNPFLDRQAEADITADEEDLMEPTWAVMEGQGSYYSPHKKHNSASHQRDGQNVLFNDSHVSWEEHPNVGINNDNIWMFWPSTNPTPAQKEVGSASERPLVGFSMPLTEKDAFLVNEDNDI